MLSQNEIELMYNQIKNLLLSPLTAEVEALHGSKHKIVLEVWLEVLDMVLERATMPPGVMGMDLSKGFDNLKAN